MWRKLHYAGNNEWYIQKKLREGAEAFKKMKQEKSGNKPPDGEEQKTLVNVKDASFSIIMGIPTKEWDDLPYPGLVFCQTSSR